MMMATCRGRLSLGTSSSGSGCVDDDIWFFPPVGFWAHSWLQRILRKNQL